MAVKRQQVFGQSEEKGGKLSGEHAKRLFREMVLLRYLCSPFFGHVHPNLVTLFDVRAARPLPSDAFVFMLMNNAGSSLKSIVRGRDDFSLEQVRDLAWQLLLALHYVHSAGFVHRDIKSDNVLIARLPAPEMGGAREWRLTMCDLGQARSMLAEGRASGDGGGSGPKATSVTVSVGTATYKAPELAARPEPLSRAQRDYRYDLAKVDVWSAGCTIGDLFMLLGGADRQTGSVFNPRRAGVANPVWSPEEQISMVVRVLGVPTDEDLQFLRREDVVAKRAWGDVLADATSAITSAAGAVKDYLSGGGGAAAVEPPPRMLESIIPNAPPDGVELLRACFALQPSHRCTARQALDHRFFAPLRAQRAYLDEITATEALAAAVGEPEELHVHALNRDVDKLTEAAMRPLIEAEVARWREKYP